MGKAIECWKLGAFYTVAIASAVMAAGALVILPLAGIWWALGITTLSLEAAAALSALVWVPVALGAVLPTVAKVWTRAHA